MKFTVRIYKGDELMAGGEHHGMLNNEDLLWLLMDGWYAGATRIEITKEEA